MNREVADYSQDDCAVCEVLDALGYGFSHGIDRISTHRVATIDENVDNHHRSRVGFEYSRFDILAAAAEFDQNRVDIVAGLDQFLLRSENRCLRCIRILASDDLDLTNHDRIGVVRGESAIDLAAFRHVRGGSDDAGFLDDEGNQVMFAIDDEVRRDSDRQ